VKWFGQNGGNPFLAKALLTESARENSTLCRYFRPEQKRVASVLLGFLVLAATSVWPAPASADVPGLQLNPLEYQDSLASGRVKAGFVEVANPGDATVQIEAKVQGFRQTGTDGRLEFFDDPVLAAGITVNLASFELGPREAIRVTFNVDPAKLPAGGVYAAIFFRTIPPPQGSGSSYVAESANLGTLLEFTNGPDTNHQGKISAAHIPFWQFGSRLTGNLTYVNTDHSARPVGFRPSLTVKVLPWGHAPKLSTGLVLPGSARVFPIARSGSYFGLLPVIITDTETHHTTTAWIFACTGWYQWALLVVLLALIGGMLLRRRFQRPRHKTPVKRLLDGLSPKR